MAYATVMVCMGLEQLNDARLEIAGQLAERFSARVIGVAAAEFGPPLYFTAGEPAQKVIGESQAAIKTRLADLEAKFRKEMQNRVPVVEWRSAEDFPTRFIIQQARAADIIVSGVDSNDVLGDPFVRANPGDLVMQAGRPLLLVPNSCSWLDLRHVLVAWKDTTESRRAVVDALPLLRAAKEITIAEIVEKESERKAALLGVQDVMAWLLRHGLGASERIECGDASAEIEQIASETGAGVVVAGAYGHSRLREWILGGVTRQLINPSVRCSLLSR